MSPLPASLPAVALQSRGVGVLDALQEALPRAAIEALTAVTHLGDTAVLLVLAAAVYLAYDRREGAFVLGALFCGFAVVIAAKHWFALPRPPGALRYAAAAGFGFPSGHAIGATVGWGALAMALDRVSTARRRRAAAGVVVAAVALSRVAIGVHYLVDVVAGVGLGLAVLALARRLRGAPLSLFGLAAGLSALAVAVAGGTLESVALLGAVGGALAAWQVVDSTARPAGRQGVLAAAGGVGLAAAGLAALAPTRALAFAGAGALAAAVLLVPVARSRWLGG